MKDRRAVLVILAIVGALAIALSAGHVARTFPGAACTHQGNCSEGEACVADSPTSSSGRCVRMRLLP
jgi:hypothetical protein